MPVQEAHFLVTSRCRRLISLSQVEMCDSSIEKIDVKNMVGQGMADIQLVIIDIQRVCESWHHAVSLIALANRVLYLPARASNVHH